MITSFHLKWRTRKLSRCVKCVLSAHVNLQIMKFGSAEAENSLSLDRATDDCQPVPSLSPPLRVNEWATKILPSSVLRISSATYLTVKSLYLSERIPQRYKFTLPRNQHLFDSFSRGGGLKQTRTLLPKTFLQLFLLGLDKESNAVSVDVYEGTAVVAGRREGGREGR